MACLDIYGFPKDPGVGVGRFSNLQYGTDYIVLPITLKLGFFWESNDLSQDTGKATDKSQTTTMPFKVLSYYLILLKFSLPTLSTAIIVPNFPGL